MASKFIHVALTGATGYCVASGMDEMLIYWDCKRRALDVAEKNKVLVETLGEPLVAGPWYNASVGTTHGGYMAHSSFPVQGSKKGTEIHITTVRKPGGASNTLLYNTVGEGEWEILRLDAMMSKGGGMAQRMDLMHQVRMEKAGADKKVAHHHHHHKKAT